MFEKHVFNFGGGGSLHREVSERLMDLDDLVIDLFDFRVEMSELEILRWVLHSEFKPAL